jgi:DNA-binding transcriptional LysR family regulator
MEMYQVRYFLSVARTLNFTRAAEECDVAQPSLSRAIKQLEAELGSELFRRERPQAILTELGQRMLPILTRCYESANNAIALAAAVKKGEAGALRVALSPTIELGLLLPRVHELSTIFDGLTLIVRRGSAAETLEFLKTGDADIAIAAAKNEEAQSLESWSLFDEGFLLSCGRAHRLANRASVGLADLGAERFVLARHGEHAEALAALLRESNVALERCYEVFSDEDLMKLVADGVGVAIVPRSLRADEATTSIPVEGLGLRRTVYLFVVAGRPRTAAASTFMNLLRAADWSPRAN